jgi:acyl dehydratase
MNSTTDIQKTAHTFDPSNFTVVPARTFEDLRVGEIFRAPSRTLTDAHASAFQAVSADNHPIHYDVEYARRHGHTATVVHGLQVLAFTAPGATLFPQYIGDAFIAFAEASCKFLKEVHAGDTLYSALEIVALTPRGDSGQVTTRATVHNQRGELVLSENTSTFYADAPDEKFAGRALSSRKARIRASTEEPHEPCSETDPIGMFVLLWKLAILKNEYIKICFLACKRRRNTAPSHSPGCRR